MICRVYQCAIELPRNPSSFLPPAPARCQAHGAHKTLDGAWADRHPVLAGGHTPQGRQTTGRHSAKWNPSSACLELVGALRIYSAWYFNNPSRRRRPDD
jgi:hypothetical protein